MNIDFTPHESNTRAACAKATEASEDHETIFGIEQEYTFFKGIDHWDSPKSATQPLKVGITAALGMTRSTAGKWWRLTWTRVWKRG